MEEELAKSPDLLKDSPSFTGSVVHAYAYWKMPSLKEVRTNNPIALE